MEDYDIIKDDFNNIAELNDSKWNHNNCYFGQILNLIPHNTETCLDIGCGKGKLSFLLSQKCKQVIAVDLSDKMIAEAKALHLSQNIKYICGNILDMAFEDNSLSAIVTTATAHHLPYEWLLIFAKKKLKKGGKLIILDLYKAKSLSDHIICAAPVIPNIIMSLIKNGSINAHNVHEHELWQKHSQHDSFMTLAQIKRLAQKHIPAVKIKRKLFWRYMLIWQK